MDYVIKASYGNDSIALIQWMVEHGHTNAFVLHNDTGWARSDWAERVEAGEAFGRVHGCLRSCLDRAFGMRMPKDDCAPNPGLRGSPGRRC